MKGKIFFITLLILVITGPVIADEMLRVDATYNMPLDNDKIDANVSFGAGAKFWGIFLASANIYTEVIPGGDNPFNIAGVRPIGLVSWGLGMEIPMGDLYVGMDWQKFYTALGYDEGAYAFSDSFKIGLGFNLSDSFSVEAFSRRFFNFTPEAEMDVVSKITAEDEEIQTIGFSAVLRLL